RGQCLEASASIVRILSTWLADWHDKTGDQPIVVARPQLAQHLRNLPDLVVAVEGQEPANDEAEAAFVQAHQQSQSALASAMVALDSGQLGLPQTDLSIALLSVALLRVWARWLNRFAASSVPYLLDNFIRRAGRISMTDQIIRVEMESRPLDIVLEMAGYLA